MPHSGGIFGGQQRQQMMPDAVARRVVALIAAVVGVILPDAEQKGKDLLLVRVQQRADDPSAPRRDPGQAVHSRAADQVKEHCFGVVLGVMRRRDLALGRGLVQRLIAQQTGGRFGRKPVLRRIARHFPRQIWYNTRYISRREIPLTDRK